MPEIRAYLNELSVANPSEPPVDVPSLLTTFVAVMRAIRKIDSRAALVSEVSFGSLYLTSDGPIARLRNDARFREHFRFLLALRNVSPFPGLPDRSENIVSEYSFQGQVCTALALAHLDDQISISFATSSFWDTSSILVQQEWLNEVGHQGVDEVEVRHASTPDHVAANAGILSDRIVPSVINGGELWSARAQMFPNLDFLDRVEDDLRTLTLVSASSVLARLRELDASSREWCDHMVETPSWSSHITSESATRRDLCYFDEGGVLHLFEMHARYTPGPGRIHFRLDAEMRRLRIAYVGPKLGI